MVVTFQKLPFRAVVVMMPFVETKTYKFFALLFQTNQKLSQFLCRVEVQTHREAAAYWHIKNPTKWILTPFCWLSALLRTSPCLLSWNVISIFTVFCYDNSLCGTVQCWYERLNISPIYYACKSLLFPFRFTLLIQQTSAETVSRFIIDPVLDQDAGQITCEAANRYGRDEKTFILSIEGQQSSLTNVCFIEK